jgi:hypothetical protein
VKSIESLDDVTQFPICWPPNKARAAARIGSPFKATVAKAEREIGDEMRRWGAPRYLISRAPAYLRGATDPGVALWFEIRKSGGSVPELRVLACDQYRAVSDNLHAIALTLNALRGVDRWGAYSVEQAIEGARLALPAPEGQGPAPWWIVLGVERGDSLKAIETAWKHKHRTLAAEEDAADRTERMIELNAAIERAREEKGP